MAGHTVKVSVVAETSKFSRAFKSLANETGLTQLASLGKQAAVAMVQVGAAVAAAAAVAGAKVIGLAGDLQQSTGAIEAVFKGTADQIKNLASTANTSVGLTKNQYQELATTLGAQLKNGGTSIDELAGKTSDLISLGADMSAMFGGSTADAVGALSSALKGERDPIEKYGVTLKQAMIDAKAAELGFADVSSAGAQQAATLALIMEQTADAQGQFARETDTWAHQVQVIKAKLTDFATSLGEKLLPAATAVATWFSETGEPALERLADVIVARAGPALSQLADWFTTTVLPAAQQFADWFTTTGLPALTSFGQGLLSMGQTLLQVAGWLIEHKTLVAGLAAPILTIVAAWQTYTKVMAIVKAAQAAYNAITTISTALKAAYAFGTYGQITADQGFLVATAGVTGALRTKAAALGSGIAAGVRAIASTTAQIASTVAHGAALAAHKIALGASAAAQWALNAAMSANPIALVVLAIAALVAALVYLYNNNETVRRVIDAAWSAIKTAIGAVADWITGTAIPAITGALDTLKELPGKFAAWFGQAKDAVSDRLGQAVSFVQALPGRIIAALASLGSMLWSAVSGHFGRMVDGATSGASAIWPFVSGIPSRIVSSLGSLGSLLLSAGSSIMTGFLNGLKSSWGAVTDFVGGIASWIAANKGPLDYDAKLLQPAGKAIMTGLRTSMAAQLPELRRTLDQITNTIADTSASLTAPEMTITATAPTAGTGQGPTIIVQCLDATPDVGRKIADALAMWQAVNGASR